MGKYINYNTTSQNTEGSKMLTIFHVKQSSWMSNNRERVSLIRAWIIYEALDLIIMDLDKEL